MSQLKDEKKIDFEELEKQIEDAMRNNRTSEALRLLSFLSKETNKAKNEIKNPFKLS